MYLPNFVMNKIVQLLEITDLVATILPQSSIPEFILQLTTKQSRKITLFTTSEDLNIFYLNSYITCVNISHNTIFDLTSSELVLFHLNALSLPMLPQLYDFYRLNQTTWKFIFLQSPMLKTFKFDDSVTFSPLKQRISHSHTFSTEGIVYLRSVKNLTLNNSQAAVTTRDSLAYKISLLTALKQQKITQIFSEVPLFFTAKNVFLEDVSEYCDFLELGMEIVVGEELCGGGFSVFEGENQRFGGENSAQNALNASNGLFNASNQPPDNTPLHNIFLPQNTLKFHQTGLWRVLNCHELENFIQNVLKFSKITKWQFQFFSKLRERKTKMFLKLENQGFSFGILFFALAEVKNFKNRVNLICDRKKFQRIFDCAKRSGVWSGMKWIDLNGEGERYGVVIRVLGDGVEVSFR